MVAVGFAALDTGGDFNVVAVSECCAQAVKFVFEPAQGPEDFVAVLFENRAPNLRVAARDACGITETAAGVITPRGVFRREKAAEARCDNLRKMADVRDDFVVLVGRDAHHLGSECVPEFYDGGGRICRSFRMWSNKTGAVFEQVGSAVFPAGLFRARHWVGSDEVRVRCERGVTEPRDFTFYAADVGYKGAGCEVGGDLSGEGDDLVDGGSEDDDAGAPDGFVGRFQDGVTPRLIAKFQLRLGTARPKYNARRDAKRSGSTGDGSSEKAGGENRELS